jgi:hypothetical protein
MIKALVETKNILNMHKKHFGDLLKNQIPDDHG